VYAKNPSATRLKAKSVRLMYKVDTTFLLLVLGQAGGRAIVIDYYASCRAKFQKGNPI
jgi:hypothetical protein